VLVDGHGQRLAVQELLLRGRELGPAARRPRAPHPLAARHHGRAPLLLARHARERVAHWGMKSETGKRVWEEAASKAAARGEIQAGQERRTVDCGASKSRQRRARAKKPREKGKGRDFQAGIELCFKNTLLSPLEAVDCSRKRKNQISASRHEMTKSSG